MIIRCIIVAGCFLVLTVNTIAASIYPDSVRNALPLLDAWKTADNKTVIAYQRFFGLDTLGTTPFIGTFTSDSFTCVGQCYQPDSSRGTVFFCHGYLDHTGTLVNGIAACLQAGWSVAVMDLPGHGLSSGERGAINDFSEYANAFAAFYSLSSPRLRRPYVYIGHSTGCAVGLEYLHGVKVPPFRQMILLAPLIRGDLYHLSRFGNAVLPPFVKTVPRWFRNASHDREFLERFRKDPLQTHRFPVRWADAFYNWHDRIAAYGGWTVPVVIIQGTGDRVVEWRYNLPWLQRHLKTCTVVTIEKARHQVLNETDAYRRVCLKEIRRVLATVSER